MRPFVTYMVFLGAAVTLAAAGIGAHPRSSGASPAQADDGPFATVARVLRHPRCLNCHTDTGFPRVGDDRRPHPQNVQRGPDGSGVAGLRCSACHRPANQDLIGVPGAPHWHLAPLSMGWESLDDHGLALALKDRTKNGGRSLEDVLEHVTEDPLVLWAWNPGAGRAAPPIVHEDFVAAFTAWIEGGAVAPDPGTTTY